MQSLRDLAARATPLNAGANATQVGMVAEMQRAAGMTTAALDTFSENIANVVFGNLIAGDGEAGGVILLGTADFMTSIRAMRIPGVTAAALEQFADSIPNFIEEVPRIVSSGALTSTVRWRAAVAHAFEGLVGTPLNNAQLGTIESVVDIPNLILG